MCLVLFQSQSKINFYSNFILKRMLIFLMIIMYIIFLLLTITSIANLDFSEKLFNLIFINSLILIDIIYVVFLFVCCFYIGSWHDESIRKKTQI